MAQFYKFILKLAHLYERNETILSGIMPLADVIVVKTRISYGRVQYRRWNETQGYWVDPYWMDVT